MNSFISNILSRHINPTNIISPRLPGIFEPQHSHPAFLTEQTTVGAPLFNTSNPQAENVEERATVTSNPQVGNVKEGPGVSPEKSFETEKPVKADLYIKPEGQFHYKKDLDSDKSISHFDHSGQSGTATKETKEIIPNIGGFSPAPDISLPFEQFQELKSPVVLSSSQTAISQQKTVETDVAGKKISIVEPHISKREPGGQKNGDVVKGNDNNETHFITPSVQHLLSGRSSFAESIIHPQENSTVIKISIGRIEVKAVSTSQPVKINRSATARPKMSLDDYLKNRNSAE